jgi:small subunit ribosomal protein S1
VVRNITDFGAFVDIGGIEGLLHISDLSWSTVEKVTDVLSTGQEIDVLVLKVDKERNRISLGYKQAQPDPWTSVGERYPEGTALKARVMRVADFGAFAELEPGVEGLIPLSEMGWNRVGRVSDRVSVGDMVDTVVIRVEPKKRRLALSMKQAQPDPWEGVLEGFTEQSLVKGRVTRLTDFGAFVEVAPGVEGLIHISELSDRRVKTCADILQEGQEVEARVLGVDVEKRRISLSIKQVKEPAEALAGDAGSEPPPPPKKRKKPLRGGLSSHYEW